MTLLEEWRERRQRMAQGKEPLALPGLPKILDFLLKRYADHPRAQEPARLPLSESLTIRRREILIHKHMHYGKFAGVKSREEAEVRLRKRLAVFNRPHAALANASLDTERDARLRETLKGDEEGVWLAVAKALDASPSLPNEAVTWLCKQFGQGGPRADEAHQLLQRCDHVGIYPWAVKGWMMNMNRKAETPAAKKFAQFIRQEGRSHHTQDELRHILLTLLVENGLNAIFHLGRLGKLDDFAMLCDMLTLPQDELSDRQRRAVAQAIILWSEPNRHPAC